MAANITVDELWDYFCDNRRELANEYQMIAGDEDQGVEIYIAEERGFPRFSVEVDGEEVYNVQTCSYLHAERTYDELLTTYIYPDADYEYAEDGDSDRVLEITSAVEDLLSVLIEEDPLEAGITPGEIEEIASLVEEYLYDQCGFSVRHPTEADGVIIQYPFGDPGEAEEEDDLPDIDP